ncbi:glycerophosphoryl diester phosphodiesterase membrane domain-containing protein [Streptomyces desertarenae]|uniref:Glycerophosphoryl diester phosphodiesterase membrane domain-containing protein n=1 Tax=Streptomyces desertarenae TaxID=2666184 RepID=A0ABW4PNR7_9ACTN
MSDSPGWVPPGSSPSDPHPGAGGNASGGGPTGRPGGSGDGAPAGETPSAPQQPPNWSAQQPPAAPQGWGTPPPPPPGQPGWGHWNQPPAAKPGVIPLRPLGIGEILDGAVTTARTHWRTALGISLAVAVMIQIVSTIATGVWLRDNSGLRALETETDPTGEEVREALSGTMSTLGVEMLAALVGTVLATAMLTMVVSRAVLGRPVTTGEAWRDSRPRLLRLLGLTLLVTGIVVGVVLLGFLPGFLLGVAGSVEGGVLLGFLGGLAGLAAAAWLWVRYSLAAPALMLERQGVTDALRRSAKLVRGSWWRIFGIQVLTALLVFLVGMIIQLPATLLAPVVSGDGVERFLSGGVADMSWTYLVIVGIGAVLASTVTLPITAGVTALLYMDQRIRREALDLELARAAGVPGHEPHPGGPAPGN